jgi:hypothetical protein
LFCAEFIALSRYLAQVWRSAVHAICLEIEPLITDVADSSLTVELAFVPLAR